jgi:hypothetical protein
MARRAIDWTAHAKALKAGKVAVRKAAPSPEEIKAHAGRHGAMLLASWGIEWPPPKGWIEYLGDLWRRQQDDNPTPPKVINPNDKTPPLRLERCKRSKFELVLEIEEGDAIIEAQMVEIARLRSELAAAIPGQAGWSAAQIRTGGMEYEREIAVSWLRQQDRPGLAAKLEALEHHGQRKSA